MNSNILGTKVQALNRQEEPAQFIAQQEKLDLSLDDNALSLG